MTAVATAIAVLDPLSPEGQSRNYLERVRQHKFASPFGVIQGMTHDVPSVGDYALHVPVPGVGILDLEFELPSPDRETVDLEPSDVLSFSFLTVNDFDGNQWMNITGAANRRIWSEFAVEVAASCDELWRKIQRQWVEWVGEFETGRAEAAREWHDEQRLEERLESRR
jgi:hypothetical protein